VKRAPLEERKKRKKVADAAAAPAEGQQQQQAAEEAPVAPAQPPPAKKARPAKPSKPSAEALAASDLKHKWVRAVVVGGLSPEVVASAVQLAKAAGEVGMRCCLSCFLLYRLRLDLHAGCSAALASCAVGALLRETERCEMQRGCCPATWASVSCCAVCRWRKWCSQFPTSWPHTSC
jgi:hypothetical protein